MSLVVDPNPKELSLGELKSLVSARGEAALQRLYGEAPVLVIRLQEHDEQAVFNTPLGTHKGDLSDTDPPTMAVIENTTVRVESGLRAIVTSTRSRIVPVLKSERNPFAGLVTIGRARNNDVRLKSSQVSKMHGWLANAGEQWKLKDHNSTNGTFHNGERLERGAEVELQSGDELGFGDVVALFLDSAGLQALCGMVGD